MTHFGHIPFVGRHREIDELAQRLAGSPLVSLHGGLGAGKTRLASALAIRQGVPCAFIASYPGDRASALRARAERALRCGSGALARTLARRACVLIFDDIHFLDHHQATDLFASLRLRRGNIGRIVVVSRHPLDVPVGTPFAELELGGLDTDAAAKLWAHLEGRFGKASGFTSALAYTRGMPLALRREYARAQFGGAAWDLLSLEPRSRAVLEALAILRTPAAPVLLAALLSPPTNVEATIAHLIARQLVDVTRDGHIRLHDAVRFDVLHHMNPEDKRRLSATAAQRMADTIEPCAHGAEPLARVREMVWHWLAAGHRDLAATTLLANRDLAARSGGAGEFESLLEALGDPPQGDAGNRPGRLDVSPAQHDLTALTPDQVRALTLLRIELAARRGRYAEASERAGTALSGVPPLLRAKLALGSRDVATAQRILLALLDEDEDERALAVSLLVEIDLLAGRPEVAAARLASLGDLSSLTPDALARVHQATARLDEYQGRFTAMDSELERAKDVLKQSPPSFEASTLMASIDVRRAIGFARRDQLGEAVIALEAAAAAALDLDTVALADEVATAQAFIAYRRGDCELAANLLHDLVPVHRARRDELSALHTELQLAELEIVRGQPARAAKLVGELAVSSARPELGHLAARASAVVAAVDVIEHRLDAALSRLEELSGNPALDAASAARVAVRLATTRALRDQRTTTTEPVEAPGLVSWNAPERQLAAAEMALDSGDGDLAIALARDVIWLAEYMSRPIELAAAWALVSRIELARGRHADARSAATRALRDASAAGLVHVQVHVSLVLCALARHDRDRPTAIGLAQAALERSTAAGLPIEALVAHSALHTLVGGDALAEPPFTPTMAPAARKAAARFLADLGLAPCRLLRLVNAGGASREVADASPEALRLDRRALAVDGIRDLVWRRGNKHADLRHRSTLKHLLFFFAAAPGKTLSKAELAEAMWGGDYDKSRDDDGLFNNIRRVRSLLGDDGYELLPSVDGGYRFLPPPDFLFIVPRTP